MFAKEYNLYNCKVHGNESKSNENLQACDRSCKPLNRKLKIKVNERNNKVLLIVSENSKEVDRRLLTNEERDFIDQNNWDRGNKLEIFDQNNWSLEIYKMDHGIMELGGYSLSDGKIFRYLLLNDSWDSRRYICGK